MNSKQQRQQKRLVERRYSIHRWMSIEKKIDIAIGLLLFLAALTALLELAVPTTRYRFPAPFHSYEVLSTIFVCIGAGIWRIRCSIRFEKILRFYIRPARILRRDALLAIIAGAVSAVVAALDTYVYFGILMAICDIVAVRYWWRANKIEWLISQKRG